jgi:flavin-dependent dehydrogenase
VLDTVLLDQAARAGTEVFQESVASDIELGETIQVHARTPDGSWRVTCRYLVGADGRNSTVAHALQRPGEPRETRDGRIGLQWYTKSHDRLSDEIHLYLLPFGYFGIVNLGDGAANLAMVLDTRRAEAATRDIGALIALMRRSNLAIDRNLGDLLPCSEVQTTSPITPRPAHRGTERILMAGDAGRIVEPFTGEGIYLALKEGMATGEELLARLDGGKAPSRWRGSRFWANAVVSPVLRHPALAQAAVSVGATLPLLTRMTSRVVARL